MPEYDNTNRISIWENDEKMLDTHADYTGTLNVNGVDYWVNLWKRKPNASARAPVLSGSVKPKEQRKKAAAQNTSHGYSGRPGITFDETEPPF